LNCHSSTTAKAISTWSFLLGSVAKRADTNDPVGVEADCDERLAPISTDI